MIPNSPVGNGSLLPKFLNEYNKKHYVMPRERQRYVRLSLFAEKYAIPNREWKYQKADIFLSYGQ